MFLTKHCWLNNYHRPIPARFAEFLERNGNSEAVAAIAEAKDSEIAVYKSNAA
ncbi:hypothetical protein [Halochromatium glycolicum]|uniref:hypothetical protein n=1 Tax=Halochromatium glycolicum TaxID=85075 RepID=UPI001A92786F|nr:hypothetical protein [Halochromatium glycolicum]